MKRSLVLLLVLAPCLPLAAIDFGAGADVSIDSGCYTEDSSRASESDVLLRPAVVMKMSPKVELRPYALLGFHTEKNPDLIAVAVLEDLSQVYFGAGAGLFYAFIQKDSLALLIGPDLRFIIIGRESGASAAAYQSYFHMALALSLPIYLDVRLTDKLYLRSGAEIQGLSYEYLMTEQGGVKETTGTFAFADYWQDLFALFVPYFGFYYMF